MVSVDGFKPPTAWMSTKRSIAELHTQLSLEVWEGIEPPWVDLQSTAWPLRHQTILAIIYGMMLDC